jgi:hypothetical protein
MKTEIHQDEEGYRSEHIHDDAGKHVRTTDYEPTGKMTCDIRYEHNALGDVTGWKVWNAEGMVFRRFEVDYCGPGIESETREYGPSDNLIRREVYVHDSENRRIETHYYDSEGILRGKGIEELDEGRHHTVTRYYDTEGNLLQNPAA